MGAAASRRVRGNHCALWFRTSGFYSGHSAHKVDLNGNFGHLDGGGQVNS